MRPALLSLPNMPVADTPAARSARRRRERLRMLGLTYASSLLDAFLWGVLALSGEPAWATCLQTIVASSLICGGFYLAMRHGWSERFADPYLTSWQMALMSGVHLGVAWASPHLGVLALSVIFIVFAFGALRLRPRQLALMWFVMTVATGVLFAFHGTEIGMPHEHPLQAALSTLWLSTVLGRCGMVGLYGAHVRHALSERNRELAEAKEHLYALATRDGLTGSLNRNAILERLSETMSERRSGKGVAVALLDLDHFKSINDTLGHGAGDSVLRKVVACTARLLRSGDRLGRYGGEEFLLVLTSVADADSALAAMDRLCEGLAAEDWSLVAPGLKVTVSIGVAFANDLDNADLLVRRADEALYDAKRAGRNRAQMR
jgi:diguanylate cyclase (GGDEF)-like protein